MHSMNNIHTHRRAEHLVLVSSCIIVHTRLSIDKPSHALSFSLSISSLYIYIQECPEYNPISGVTLSLSPMRLISIRSRIECLFDARTIREKARRLSNVALTSHRAPCYWLLRITCAAIARHSSSATFSLHINRKSIHWDRDFYLD